MTSFEQLHPEHEATSLEAADPVPTRRAEFHLLPYADPEGGTVGGTEGGPVEIAYFAGNSLGLQPRRLSALLTEELDDWARLGVEGHLEAHRPWVDYHERLREPAARLVGALPAEVVAMNTLTVNLHLMMASFYRPTPDRFRIVIEDSAFPSDSYAVRSQARWHGFDPDDAVLRLVPREGEDVLRTEDICDLLARQGDSIALVLLGGVNYYTGELVDMPAITEAAHRAGAYAAFDLAHAAGNVPLQLHDWGVDWAAWCTYKYLNSGPGAVAGAFVHERHLTDDSLPRLHGWWSTDPAVRFEMRPLLDRQPTADAWSMSNPPILALAPVLASLEMFDESGIATLRQRSERLTAYLESLFDTLSRTRPLQVITPRDPARRGSQLSLRCHGINIRELTHRLRAEFGVIADAREPDVIRFAPVPMYVTYHDCWRAAAALAALVEPVEPTPTEAQA